MKRFRIPPEGLSSKVAKLTFDIPIRAKIVFLTHHRMQKFIRDKTKRPKVPRVSIFLETATSWGRRVVAGILEHARSNGPWHIQIEPRGPDEPFHMPSRWEGDGIIARISTSTMATSIANLGVPVVNITSIQIPGVNYPRIVTNPKASGRLAAELFWSRGFRDFGYVGNPDKDYVQAQFHAFEDVLSERGHTCAFFRESDNFTKLARWLSSLPKPAGVYCWGPNIGRRIIDTCLEIGIDVPHDVSVLGADFDELLSEASNPPQSGIQIAAEQIGRTAGSMLEGLMKGQPAPRLLTEIDPIGVISKLSTNTLAVEDPQMARTVRYILAEAHNPITVSDVLRKNPMARRSLERNFRKIFGCSVAEQIRKTRIDHARRLLATTNDPVTLIAERCGFSSYNYLSRVFREETGLSPRAFRARSLGENYGQ